MPFRADLKGPFVRSANYLYPTTTGSLRIRYRFYLPLNGFAIKFVPIIGVQNRLVKSFFQIFSTGSIFHRARAACFIAPEICSIPWCAGRERTLFPFRSCVSPCQSFPRPINALDAEGHEVSFIAHAQRVSSRRRFALFRSALDAGGHEVSFIAPEICPIPWCAGRERTRSVFHRARAACFTAPEICPIPWCAGRGRQPSPFRGDVSFPAGTKCLQSRTRSVFHRAGDLPYSVARWTREDTKCLSSRRKFTLFRGALDARGHFSSSAVVSRHAKSFPRPINALDAGGREVPFVTPAARLSLDFPALSFIGFLQSVLVPKRLRRIALRGVSGIPSEKRRTVF